MKKRMMLMTCFILRLVRRRLNMGVVCLAFAAGAAQAEPSVTINGVGLAGPWDQAKGAIAIDYTLAGLEAGTPYKVAFDMTAGGRTASVTNDAATLAAGAATKEIDTVALFGKAVADKDATVKIRLVAVRRIPGVQLWANGPFFAECNLGATNPEDYGSIYDFQDAQAAVSGVWHTPTSAELGGLISECDLTWDGARGGWIFKGKGEYSSNSIFLPAAGKSVTRDDAGSIGYYWSTSIADERNGYHLYLDHNTGAANCRTADIHHVFNSMSVRSVRSADSPSWEEVVEATGEAKFPLGMMEVALPTGMIGYGYVVSNLTSGTEIERSGNGLFALPFEARIGIYAVPEEGYAIVGTNPYVIERMTSDTVIDAGRLPKVPPTVRINEVRSIDTWDGEKGPVAVDYSLAGLNANLEYKVAFDIVANGGTAGFTNAAARLSDGRQTVVTNDTAALFGEVVVADDAMMKLSLIALKPAAEGDPEREEVVESTVGKPFLLGMAEIELPTGMIVYGYVVSNLTDAVEIAPAECGRYVLPLGAKVGIYAVPEEGYAIVGENPYVIDSVACDTAIDAGRLPKVPPTVIVGKVGTVDPWNAAKGEIAVDYTLVGLEAGWRYKVAFDITANGRTVSVTNDAAELSEGTRARAVIETVPLFGAETTDKDATVKISLIAVTPIPAGRLWADGPVWAEYNLGESEVLGHPEYGALYDFGQATDAVGDLGDGWRLPTVEELETLLDASVCARAWNGDGKGWTFTGVGLYASHGIYLPAAGSGNGRSQVGAFGAYRSSSGEESGSARGLLFNETEAVVMRLLDSDRSSVRVVKDVDDEETVKASEEAGLWLGPGGEDCPWKVSIGDHPHLAAAWTCGDGSVTNAIDGAVFRVLDGTEGVKVIFTADNGWKIVGDAVVELGTVTEDIAFAPESPFHVPTLRHEAISYIDADGVKKTKLEGEFDVVTTGTRTLTNGWYAVVDNVVFATNANLTVHGDVHLVLCDGASLTIADPGAYAAGIAVVGTNCLAIYGQEAGTGVLTAQGGQYSAGIGGYTDGGRIGETDCGAVTIFGGTVVATGGDNAAGIGGSPLGFGGPVAIRGGTVTATGGVGAAGIGGYAESTPRPPEGGVVEITGGKVTATGVKGIHWKDISISGGVFAHRPEAAWCAEHFGAFANPDSATSGDYPYAVLPSCTVTVGECPAHVSAAWTSGEGTVTNALAGTSFAAQRGADGVRVIFTADAGWALVGDVVVNVGTVTDDVVFGVGNDYTVPQARYLLGDIPYRDWDGTQMTNAALPKYVFTFLTDRTRKLTDGWYAVTNGIVFPAGEYLEVLGTAHLVLCDGASLTITNSGIDCAAVAVSMGAALTIYGQEAGTGALVALGGSDSAGIGGFADWANPSQGNCGTVTINGGTVTAQGGENAAGIGGGYAMGVPSPSTGDVITYADGGTVTINGGTVTATGGDGVRGGGAGIGGGRSGAGGRVTIRSGAVSTTGGAGAEDIGRGAGLQDNGEISVSGGIFARPVQDAWLADDCSVITNQDAATVAAYPWAVVPYPAAWPAADDAVKAKFGAWRNGDGAEADLAAGAAQKAFLLNVPVTGIKELKIESLEVDTNDCASIVVGAPGAFFFDRLDLGNINGVLYVHAGDTLDTMEPKPVPYWTTTMGKANITVKAHFIRAAIGFKTP